MNKKPFYLSFLSIILVLGVLFTYQFFTKDESQVDRTLIADTITYSELHNHMNALRETHAYLMCEKGQDCDYLLFSLLKPIMGKYNLTTLSTFTIVDMDDVVRQISPPRLRELYTIQTLPAIILVNGDTNSIIDNLEYNRATPLTMSQLETWLLHHGLLR